MARRGGGSSDKSSHQSSLVVAPRPPRAPSAALRSTHMAFLAILLVQLVILVAMKALLVPTQTSPIAAFTSSLPAPASGPDATTTAAGVRIEAQRDTHQEEQHAMEENASGGQSEADRKGQLQGPLTIGACRVVCVWNSVAADPWGSNLPPIDTPILL